MNKKLSEYGVDKQKMTHAEFVPKRKLDHDQTSHNYVSNTS